MASRQREMASLWHSFLYEVNKATASLMYLLQGMESVRYSELRSYSQLPPSAQPFAPCFPKLPYVVVPLSMSGIGFDLNSVLGREGEAEQLAFKGWVEQVYFLWESRFRNEMRDALEGPCIIRPEGDAIGDFRLIRNDLIHNNGVVSEEYSGKCRILNWFKPGDNITLGMRHVLDFLNQMGFITKTPGFLDNGAAASWTIFPWMEDDLASIPAPRLVSLRIEMDNQWDDGSSWHVASVVFENGVFCHIPIQHPADGTPVPNRIDFIGKTRIDEDGNLRFANGFIKERESLYQEAVAALLGKGTKIEGVGVPGPPFRISR
ncbi:MAG: hypothetical protein OXE17_16195 [Chloroflexi bacterium]|nr:hypothetical protein [Chloroflexota bacterium]